VRYHRSDATETEDGLSDWQSSRQVVPGKVSIASYDYKASSSNTSFDQTAVEQGNSGNAAQSTLEQYDAPGLYYASDADSLSHYARLRQQANDAQAKSFQGTGTARGLIAGQWFRLDDHPAHEDDSAEQREFVVTKQSFSASNNLPSGLKSGLPQSLLASNDSSAPYTSSFSAQRRGIALTPSYANTALAKPSSNGVQTATVVGPSGEEVHTDEQGRIKVQFHWQRTDEHPTIGANLDDKSSCWLRVAMPSAGHAWGHQFIPRIGQEVLVDFIEGDIDRPLVTIFWSNLFLLS
jgi:type VI secretion system secreted protein VgrG